MSLALIPQPDISKQRIQRGVLLFSEKWLWEILSKRSLKKDQGSSRQDGGRDPARENPTALGLGGGAKGAKSNRELALFSKATSDLKKD